MVPGIKPRALNVLGLKSTLNMSYSSFRTHVFPLRKLPGTHVKVPSLINSLTFPVTLYGTSLISGPSLLEDLIPEGQEL